MGMGQGGGRRLDSDVQRLHCRVLPLRGTWGSRQLLFDEHAYPSPRAFTVPGAFYSTNTTLFRQDSGCDEVAFANSTTAGDTTLSSHDSSYDEFLISSTSVGDVMHSSTDSHFSGHVYSSTSSRRA
jgi:hypothetical protein